MSKKHSFSDYEPVTRPRPKGAVVDEAVADESERTHDFSGPVSADQTGGEVRQSSIGVKPSTGGSGLLKRGHALSYAGLFLYTTVIYFRPSELFESLSSLKSLSYWIAIATLIFFLPTQLSLENRLTFRTREVNLVLLLFVIALISMPLATDPALAWETFNFLFVKVVIIFIVMVNVVRTMRRLNGLLYLALAVSCVISAGAINNFRLGNFEVEGYRAVGEIGGMFGNPNAMALYVSTMLPIPVAFLLRTRNVLAKAIYGACALLMLSGTFVTFSRGAFLGLAGAGVVLAWKLGRRNRLLAIVFIFCAFGAALVLAPGGYGGRLASIVDHTRDLVGSVQQRQAILYRSILVALRHPLLGVGMGNFSIYSYQGLGTHNAYTQVAAELGLPALIAYIMFLLAPLKRLRRMEEETLVSRHASRFHYLAVGLQASLVCYLIGSFFINIAYEWNAYYTVAYAVCLDRIYRSTEGMAEVHAPVAVARKGAVLENDEPSHEAPGWAPERATGARL